MTTATATIRPLAPADLDAVVAIDAAAEGRTRREYIERRLLAAQREPALHAQFGAVSGGSLVGCLLARLLAGEFGQRRAALRIELVGVDAAHRGQGVGRALFGALEGWARRHGAAEVRTIAGWRDATILGWLASLGFSLAPEVVVEGAVDAGWLAGRDEVAASPETPAEIDYGRSDGNDAERAARDTADVRSMTTQDLDAIVRIDREITGRDRRDYIAARLAETMADSAVRVSLCARREDSVAGYLMARADLGDFGRTEPVAVLDTLGVHPGWGRQGVGRAMVSQLFANLGALRVERVETVVPLADTALLAFLQRCGFAAGQRLSFVLDLARSG